MSNKLELQVQNALQMLFERYTELDRLADVMLEKQAQQQEFSQELRQIEVVKSDIKAVEDQTAEIRDQYISSREHASPKVQELTRSASEVLVKVMKKIEKLETLTQEAFQRLVPQVDENVRANQMKQAYGAGRV